MPTRQRVLVVTGEPLGARLAGPAIRALEMARRLAAAHEVTLASLGPCDLEVPGIEVLRVNRRSLPELVDRTDVLVFQGVFLSLFPWVISSGCVLVADIYDPFHLETLEQEADRLPGDRWAILQDTVDALNLQLAHADFFLCASEKQRDFWLGQLAAQSRINPSTYDDDPSLRRLIDVAPFGLADTAPVQRRHGLRGAIDGIGEGDKVVIWGGGVYNWFDPLTLVRAIAHVAQAVPNVRLVFMGMTHPNPDVPEMTMAARTRELATELGLTNRHVFFNENWVPYTERADLLLDADLGVSCHFDHIETEFSFRTRILDYLWAGLPIVCTSGDSFGNLVESESLGATAPPEDVHALANAITELLTNDELREAASQRVRTVARGFTWKKALAPLTAFIEQPHRAPDRHPDTPRPKTKAGRAASARRPSAGREDLALIRTYLEQGGVTELVRRVAGRVQRVARQSLAGR